MFAIGHQFCARPRSRRCWRIAQLMITALPLSPDRIRRQRMLWWSVWLRRDQWESRRPKSWLHRTSPASLGAITRWHPVSTVFGKRCRAPGARQWHAPRSEPYDTTGWQRSFACVRTTDDGDRHQLETLIAYRLNDAAPQVISTGQKVRSPWAGHAKLVGMVMTRG